jgi:hypothetical protein
MSRPLLQKNEVNGSLYYEPKAGIKGNDAVNHASLIPMAPSFLFINKKDKVRESAAALHKLAIPMQKGDLQSAIFLSSLKKETAVEKRNSNLKKIAIFTSLLNFILSIIL